MLIVETHPEYGTTVLEVGSPRGALRMAPSSAGPAYSTGVLAKGAAWNAYSTGDGRTIVILEVP